MERIYNIDDYKAEAKKTAVYSTADYPLLALSEEVGEVLGKIAKYCRKNGKDAAEVIHRVNCGEIPDLAADLRKELGDVMWQWALLCDELGFTPSQIITENIEKLTDRQKRNVLNGEGDNR